MSSQIEAPKRRILCLHGIGTNSKVLEAQTAALRRELGPVYSYEFIDGAHPWPAARGIRDLFGASGAYRSYFDGSIDSFKEAVDDLTAYVRDDGPFDALLGFSLGGALAAAMLLHDEAARLNPVVPCAIFISSILPCDSQRPDRVEMSLLRAENFAGAIRIPTVHALSLQDNEFPGQSAGLVDMCCPENRLISLHSAGHGVPFEHNEVARLAQAINEAMDRLK